MQSGGKSVAVAVAHMQRDPDARTAALFLAIICLIGGLLTLNALWLARPGVALKDLPDLSSYRVDPYLRAANVLQQMGKERAIDKLQLLAQEKDMSGCKTIILCRILFTNRKGSDFQPPILGMPSFVAGELSDWPREPIEVVDGVPFLITYGYSVAGHVPPPSYYVDYCVKECDWNKVRFAPKSIAAKHSALAKLLSYPKLKAPAHRAEVVREFLTAQIQRVSDQRQLVNSSR